MINVTTHQSHTCSHAFAAALPRDTVPRSKRMRGSKCSSVCGSHEEVSRPLMMPHTRRRRSTGRAPIAKSSSS